MANTKKNKKSEEEIIRLAKIEGQKWIDAFQLEGRHDNDMILEELSRRTFEGAPVVALVTNSPKDSVNAVVFGVAMNNIMNKLGVNDEV